MTTLAPKFGISDVALKKRCNNRGIPTPGVGYWAKVEAGQKVARSPLPASWSPMRKKKREKTEQDIKIFVPPIEAYPTDGLAIQATHALKGKGSLRIDVTKAHRERAAWLWSELIGRLGKHNLKLSLSDGCAVTDGIEAVSLEIRELSNIYHRPPDPKRDYISPFRETNTIRDSMHTGFLEFRAEEVYDAGCSRQWRDTQATPLDERLDQIAEGLAVLLRRKHEIRLEREEWNRRWEEERRKGAIEAEKQRFEKQRREKLVSMSNDFVQAERIRQFIGQFKEGDIQTWALQVANDLDPTLAVQSKIDAGEDPFSERKISW